MLIRGKKLTHRLLGNLLQLGGGGEDRCKLENVVLSQNPNHFDSKFELYDSNDYNDDKDDCVSPETCARWNESLEGKFARKANPLGWPVPPG